MSNRIKQSIVIVALSSAAVTAGLAFAQTDTISPATAATPAPTAIESTAGSNQKLPWLNLGEVYERVTAAGYTDVSEIEREKQGYEVKARDAQGRFVKLYINPLDGTVMKKKVRDDD
ncbi:PepSY domain-containing protein [Achromobacter sp. F4_2707]|uniref:PepSY domain-containing protein n=1 Tax=Achromobacter sp. F4_2707 TaxID=3114286 RepID=UPI0039C68476